MIRKIFIICLLFFFTLSQAQNSNEKLEQLYKDVTISQLRGSDMEKTISEVTSILELKSLTTEDRLKGLLVLANLHKFKGENTLSIEVAEKARRFAFQKKEYLWEARLLGFISSIYRISEMSALSEEKLEQAFKVAEKVPESEELYGFYTNAYHEKAYYANSGGEYEQALLYMHKSTSWAKKQSNTTSKFSKASNYQFFGRLFNRLNNPDSAIFYFKKSLLLLGKPLDLNTKTLENYVYTDMGHSYMLKGDYEASRYFMTKVLEDSLQFRPTDLNRNLYRSWVQYYQYKGSIDSMDIFNQKVDSINRLMYKNTTTAVNDVTKMLQDENKLLLQKSNKWTYGIVIGVIIIFAALYFLTFTRRDSKVDQNQKEKEEVKKVEALIVKEVKKEELHIAKDTEERLVSLLMSFEKNKEYLNVDVSQTLLANQFNTNTKYIAYVLRKMYDKDFNTYINELRVSHLIHLLETEPKYRQYKISYLADVAGFSSHSKFAAVFKKIKGCSPSEFITALENKPKTNSEIV